MMLRATTGIQHDQSIYLHLFAQWKETEKPRGTDVGTCTVLHCQNHNKNTEF